MDVDEPPPQQQEQQEDAAAAPAEQRSSKEPETTLAVMKDAFPALHHGHSSGDAAAAAADAAGAAEDAAAATSEAAFAVPAAAGSGRQRNSSRQHKAAQQLQSDRTLSRSLSGRLSFKLGTKVPKAPKDEDEKREKARLPWQGDDDNWGEGFVGSE
jgi:hypothetical protein